MRGKDLKQAKIYKVNFDKERPLTFDFNALCELQELGYHDPAEAMIGLQTMNLRSMKALMYAALVAGQCAEDENQEFDLSSNKVGQILGMLMHQDHDEFVKCFEQLGEAVKNFFPEPKEESEEADPKN